MRMLCSRYRYFHYNCSGGSEVQPILGPYLLFGNQIMLSLLMEIVSYFHLLQKHATGPGAYCRWISALPVIPLGRRDCECFGSVNQGPAEGTISNEPGEGSRVSQAFQYSGPGNAHHLLSSQMVPSTCSVICSYMDLKLFGFPGLYGVKMNYCGSHMKYII